MKILTLNFVTCARKACKASPAAFPLRPREAELEIVEQDINPLFVRNVLPRLEWDALREVCGELGLQQLPSTAPSPDDLFTTTPAAADTAMADAADAHVPTQQSPPPEEAEPEEPRPSQLLRDLHTLLLETTMRSGKLVCGNCGHEYAVKEGIANFLLPSHLV